MTVVPPPERSQEPASKPPTRRMTIPPRTEPRRFSRPMRRVVFASSLALLVTAIPILAFMGYQAVLDQDSAINSFDVVEPDAPAFEALVTPTETMLLLQEDQLGTVVAFSLISANPQGGGSVLLIPTGLRIATPGSAVDTLGEIHARDGATSAAAALSAQFRVGFGSTVVVDDDAWQNTVAPAAPVAIDNPNDVLAVARDGIGGDGDAEPEVAFDIGELELGADDVAAYLSLRNPAEDERALLFRQDLFWRSWVAALRDGAEVGGTGQFSAIMGALSKGPVTHQMLPVDPVESLEGGEEDPEFEMQADEAVQLLAELVPFPTGGRPGDRTRIRLLNGTDDPRSTLDAAVLLVPAGAEITILGNDASFDRSRTVVRYRDPVQRDAARTMADALGTTLIELDSAPPTGSVDVTVIIGQDFELQAK